MQHRIQDGRIYRDLNIEAADVHAARRHISAQRPIPPQEQRVFLRCIEEQRET